MMYDELIKMLRTCAERDSCIGWREACAYLGTGVCDNKAEKAADAIEELQKCLDGVEADNDSLCATIDELERDLKRSKEYEAFWEKKANEALKKFQTTVASMPRWIPVTERLPDVFKHVLVNIPGMAPHPTVQEAFREKNGMWYSNGFRYEADEITHWMPLPSAEGLNET